jgi:hypothetical protein
MAELDNIASELLKSANEADLIYKRTRDQSQRDKAVRLRRIVENLKTIDLPSPVVNQIVAGTNVSISPVGGTGIVTVNSAAGGAQFKIDYTYNITGAKDNVNTNYNTSQPFLANTTRVYLNGQRLTRGAGYDYVEAGVVQISMALPLAPTDQMIIEYEI